MNLDKNRSRIWFKILKPNYSTLDSSGESWEIPQNGIYGKVMYFKSQTSKVYNGSQWESLNKCFGTWLISNPLKFYLPHLRNKVFIAKLFEEPQYEIPGMIWVHKTSLVREADFKTLSEIFKTQIGDF